MINPLIGICKAKTNKYLIDTSFILLHEVMLTVHISGCQLISASGPKHPCATEEKLIRGLSLMNEGLTFLVPKRDPKGSQ